MAEQKFCQDCSQKHQCQEAYRQLGNTKSPSVVFKVVIAFLVPLVVFIAALVASEKILAVIINSKEVRIVLSFLSALLVTFVSILIIKAVDKRPMRKDTKKRLNTD